MLPPVSRKKFAVTDPGGFDGAMYVCQTDSYFWAWVVWRIFRRGDGQIIKLNPQNFESKL
jgi:hypothetical protein